MKKIFNYFEKFLVQILMIVFAILAIAFIVFYTNSLETIKEQKALIDRLSTYQNKECDSIVKVKDSIYQDLYWEYFQANTDNERHEEARDEIFSKYPKVKEEYDNFYNNEID